jgi:hypothetical protein
MISKNDRCGSGATAPTIENDIVGAGFEREIDVLLNVLSREFEADGDASG